MSRSHRLERLTVAAIVERFLGHDGYARSTKGGKPRHLPLHPRAAKALRAWRPICPALDDLVFPVEVRDGSMRMGRGTDLLGLPALMEAAKVRVPVHPWHALRHTWHALRHTFASYLVMHGASLSAVQRLLGHASLETTMRYAHLAPDFLVAEMGRLPF